jgi:hypothetical protein
MQAARTAERRAARRNQIRCSQGSGRGHLLMCPRRVGSNGRSSASCAEMGPYL